MEFKKTVAALAITASSAFALMAPPEHTKTICLNAYEGADGSLYAGNCDEARNNETLQKELLENGCAKKQVSLTARKYQGGKYDIQVRNCLPPGVIQL